MLMQPAAATLYETRRTKPRVRKMDQEWAALRDFKDLYESTSNRSPSPSSSLDILCHIKSPHIEIIFKKEYFFKRKDLGICGPSFCLNPACWFHFFRFWFPCISHIYSFLSIAIATVEFRALAFVSSIKTTCFPTSSLVSFCTRFLWLL